MKIIFSEETEKFQPSHTSTQNIRKKIDKKLLKLFHLEYSYLSGVFSVLKDGNAGLLVSSLRELQH